MQKRLRLFFTGVIIGCIFLYFIIRQRKTEIFKTPQEIVFEKLDRSAIINSSLADCQIKCIGIDTSGIKEFFKEGDIDFSKSRVHDKPFPTYHIEKKMNNDNLKMEIMYKDSISEILSLTSEKAICPCEG